MAAILDKCSKTEFVYNFFLATSKNLKLKFRDIEFSNDIMSHSIPLSMPISQISGEGGGGIISLLYHLCNGL